MAREDKAENRTNTYVLESNELCLLSEASSAEEKSVFSDNSHMSGANSALS